MRSQVQKGTRKVGYVTIRAKIESEMPSQLTTWDSGRKRRVGGTRYVMNTAVPKEPAPRKRRRDRLYPARMDRTIDTPVATTLMRRLFLIQVRKSVFWKR